MPCEIDLSGVQPCFDKLGAEYNIELHFINETPLTVGGGSPLPLMDSSADIVLLRSKRLIEKNGRFELYEGPIIPGSSMKGVFRSLSERLAIGLGLMPLTVRLDDEVTLPCTGDMLADIYKLIKDSYLEDFSFCYPGEKLLEKLQLEPEYCSLARCIWSPTNVIYGAPWTAGRVWFSDGYPLADRVQVSVRSRVAIDRITMAQHPGHLFSVEVIEPGYEWVVNLRVKNLNLEHGQDNAVRLFKLTLKWIIDNGLSIGRSRTSGYGRLLVIKDKSRVRSFRVDEDSLDIIVKDLKLDDII